MADELMDALPESERIALRDLAERSVMLVEKTVLSTTPVMRELTQGEFSVLLCLDAREDDTTAVELAEQVSLTRPRITQIVSSLEHRGFVTRAKDDVDRRKVNIRITESGHEIVVRQREIAIELHEKYLLKLGDDAEAFVRILEKTLGFIASSPDAVKSFLQD